MEADPVPKRLGAALLDVVGAAVLVAAVLEDAAVVPAGVFPKSDGVWVGAVVAADVVAGAVVVVAENKVDGFEAGVEPLPAVLPPNMPGAAAVAVVLLAGVVVAAGLEAKRDGVLVPAAASAGFEVAAALPKRLDPGVDDAPPVEAENRPGFCVDSEVDGAAPPKRLGPELLAAG